MNKFMRLFLVTLAFSAFSGGLLALLNENLEGRISYQELKFVRGPAILQVMQGSTNDPLVDRFKLKDGDTERSFYVGVFGGKPNVVAFETYGKGFDGDIFRRHPGGLIGHLAAFPLKSCDPGFKIR